MSKKKKAAAAGMPPAGDAADPAPADALPPPPPDNDCDCRQRDDGLWFRFVDSGGRKKRVPPGFDSKEECEASCR